MEYLHHLWEFAFPFLTLGNGLSRYSFLIQLYEYTGVWGGSLWILVSNIAIFQLVYAAKSFKDLRISKVAIAVITIIVPMSISSLIYLAYSERGSSMRITSLHPNVDCWNEKYTTSPDSLVDLYVRNTVLNINDSTDYVLWPETAITRPMWLATLRKNELVGQIRDKLISTHPNLRIISGVILCEVENLQNEKDAPESANVRFNQEFNYWYKTYNAAIQISSANVIPFRTKQNLVPIEETIPYAEEFAVVRKVVHSLGGYTFASREGNNDIFESHNRGKVATLICYESIFGETSRQLVKKGAEVLFVILNEGWYRNHSGAAQFMYYARIRAVENRRAVARSSNDGISCLINQRGDIIAIKSDFESGAISGKVLSNRVMTVYTVFGDFLPKIAIALCLLLSMAEVVKLSVSISKKKPSV